MTYTHRSHTGWHYRFIWFLDEGIVEVRSSGRPAYYMTLAGAERFIRTLEPINA